MNSINIMDSTCLWSSTDQDSAAQGHRMAEIYGEHARPVLLFLLRWTRGNLSEAEDLLQETMLRAWRYINTTPDSADGLRRWLLTVAHHAAVDSHRRRQHRPVEVEFSEGAEFTGGDDTMRSALAVDSFRQALAELTPSQRAIVRDLYAYGHPASHVAALHGIPIGTVKSRAHHALRALRDAASDAVAASHVGFVRTKVSGAQSPRN
jgi:RNA polymerase sigma-70 factor (ECF subfamily)